MLSYHYLAKKDQNFSQCSLSNSRPSVSDTLNIVASKVPELLGLKVVLPKWLLPFLSLLPSSFLFFFTRLNFGGKRFWENIKDCSTYLTTFSLEFSGQFDNFYGLLGCSPACLTEMRSFWYGLKNLFPCAQVRWPLKQMKSQAKQGTWIHKYIVVTTS